MIPVFDVCKRLTILTVLKLLFSIVFNNIHLKYHLCFDNECFKEICIASTIEIDISFIPFFIFKPHPYFDSKEVIYMRLNS
jgi:hypothetical protein